MGLLRALEFRADSYYAARHTGDGSECDRPCVDDQRNAQLRRKRINGSIEMEGGTEDGGYGPTGESIGKCPRCGCTLFEIRKTKRRSGDKPLRYNAYVIRCANQGCRHWYRYINLPSLSS